MPTRPKVKRISVLSTLLTSFLFLSAPITAANAASDASTDAMSSDELAAVTAMVEEAYLYGFPMLVNYSVMHSYFIDKDSGQYKAGFNEINNQARVYTPKDTAISTPNSDTPYSMVQLDLRTEPVVLCMPEIEKNRYYDVQLVDMYTDNYGYIGSRATGNGAGCYMVAGPDWQGDKPKGVDKVFRNETQFGLVVYRTQLFNPADLPNVEKIQAGYKVQTLSEFQGSKAPTAAPAIEWPAFDKAAFSTKFVEYMNFLLQFCPTTGTAEVEKPLREKFAKIGIVAGKAPDGNKPSAEVVEAFGKGIKAAMARIGETADSVGTVINGWNVGAAAGSREFYNGSWALRAAASKLGIYGNSQEEAVYPFTHSDVNGILLDGSKHTYQLTFPAGHLPPVNAFWSITMYDAGTQLLIENPFNRYLINSPMLPGLKKNADGSLTLYIQKDSPGTEKESNWLPSPAGKMFIAMRLYWPKTGDPSVYPLGKGSWQPPGIVPVRNLNAVGVTRFGDKSLENVVRTDDRYGHDGLFHGPRGWVYWNMLEYPKPIQNPNLWPDTQSTYFLGQMKLPAGAELTLHFEYPRARYFKYALYRAENNTFVSIGEDLAGPQIEPDPGSVNPFRVGANRLSDKRQFTLHVLAEDAPAKASDRARNTLYAGKDGGLLQSIIRIYLSDQGSDGAGWGPSDSSAPGSGFPTYEGKLADGTLLTQAEVIEQFSVPMPGNTKQPISDEQWEMLLSAKDNDPALQPATTPARKEPRWEKYWNIKYSILGAFKTPEDQARIPYSGPQDGGGDPSTQYLLTLLSRKFGPVYVMRGKMPTFPDTYAGDSGRGLEIMPAAQTQYWSLVSCEAAPSGHIVDGLTDMQVPLDKDGNYTIVYSRREDRPANATEENGVAWIEWSPRGEGLNSPKNREDFGMLMLRIMAPSPEWTESPANVTKPGTEEEVMGPYLPVGVYTDKATFEAKGPNGPF